MERSDYFSGQALIGEDFSDSQIRQWYADEKEACFALRGGLRSYGYSALNIFHGFSRLPHKRFRSVLSFGGGDGAELLPIADRADKLTIAESSELFAPKVKADLLPIGPDGKIPCADNSFDLVTCLNVLHHVAKVSQAVAEIARCLTPEGIAILAEPVISMGDWREQRPGLTKRERGIPLHIFRNYIEGSGLKITRESRNGFGPLIRLGTLLKFNLYRSMSLVWLDWLLSSLPIWPKQYHATNSLQKIRPGGVFIIAQRPS